MSQKMHKMTDFQKSPSGMKTPRTFSKKRQKGQKVGHFGTYTIMD